MKLSSHTITAVLTLLISAWLPAFEPPAPDSSELSYRVLEGEVEGLSRMRFYLTIVGDRVTGSVINGETRRSSPVDGTLQAGVFDLTQHSTVLWDDIDKEIFGFRGEVDDVYNGNPLDWSGECRSLVEGPNFSGGFRFREVYPAGVSEIDLYQFEKHWSQVRNGTSILRAKGGTFPQIRNPSPGEEKVNGVIRREWHSLLQMKEPKATPTIPELEELIVFEPLDPKDERGFSNLNQTVHLITATVIFNGRDQLSIQWKDYHSVGSEGWPETNFFSTYDLVSGKQIALGDFLKPGFENVLSIEIEKAFLNTHFPPDTVEKLPEGFGKKAMEDSRNFFLTSDGGIGFGYDFMQHPASGVGVALVQVKKDRFESILIPDAP